MIGIVGFGRFGELAARYLALDNKVYVYDKTGKDGEIKKVGAVSASFEDVCGQDVVILCVPISEFKDVLNKVALHVKDGALVMEVCSVKVLPARWMKEVLPENVEILATHPLFGPDSAASSLKGCKIVLCKERIKGERYLRIKDYLESKGLEVIETTPEEHDRQTAVTLALTHFIGRSLSEFGAEKMEMDTEGYKRLLHILGVVENDKWQLFKDMHRYNPYAKETREKYIDAVNEIDKRLGEK